MSALEIQRHYLGLAQMHLGDPFMPPWAGEVCVRWQRILDLLEDESAAVGTILDWAMKRALYARHVRSRGVTWGTLHRWNHVVAKLKEAFSQARCRPSFCADFILGPNSPVLEEVGRLTPYVRLNGLRWDEMEPFLQLRQELLEIDIRFGQLGGGGVFRSLDRAGLLQHHVDGVDDIAHAVSHAPAGGRASVRGKVVHRLAGRGERYRCSWWGVYDLEDRSFLDLSDPFAMEEKWGPVERSRLVSPESNVFLFPDVRE